MPVVPQTVNPFDADDFADAQIPNERDVGRAGAFSMPLRAAPDPLVTGEFHEPQQIEGFKNAQRRLVGGLEFGQDDGALPVYMPA